MHPDLIESSGRDAFGAGKFILFWQKALAGMISRRKFHPDLMEMPGGMIFSGEIHPDSIEMSCGDEIIRRPCGDEIIVDYVFYK